MTLLDEAWTALRGGPDGPGRVRVDGTTGLGSASPLDDLVVGAASAMLLAAAEHAGAADVVNVDAVHVGLAVRSEQHLLVDGRPAPAGFAPASRFWPTADGWVRTHANYPHHAAALHRALGADLAAVIGSSRAVDVEEAVAAEGGAAVAVRTAAQWSASPMGSSLRGQPLVTLRRAGEAPARTSTLQGLRVLDLTRVLAGPVATRALAARGADVLRLDPPHLPEDRSTLLETCSGKRHAHLDLRSGAGRAQLEELLGRADVLVHGYRPGALARHGLHDEDLAQRHPHLVVASLAAWGWHGPWADRRGFDSLVQAATGIAHHLRGPGGAPGALPAQVLDHSAGHLLAAAVLRALVERRHGGTWHARTSLAGLAQHLLAALAPAEPTAVPPVPPAVPAPGYLVELPSAYGTLSVVRPLGAAAWSTGVTPSAAVFGSSPAG